MYSKAIDSLQMGVSGLPDDLYNIVLDRAKHTPGAPLPHIGEGTAAQVYWLSDKSKVLKATRDQDDAKACILVSRHPKKSLVHVYDVFQIKNYYFIIAEKLTPLNGSQDRIWSNFDEYTTNTYVRDQGEEHGLDSLLSHYQLTNEWLKLLKTAFQESPPTDFKPQDVLPHLETWAHDLTSLGILWGDLYHENYMLRGHTLVLSDLGYGHVASAPQIPKGDR